MPASATCALTNSSTDTDGQQRGADAGGDVRDPGSGAYVAIERIEGTLDGRRGSSSRNTMGLMARGKPSLNRDRGAGYRQ